MFMASTSLFNAQKRQPNNELMAWYTAFSPVLKNIIASSASREQLQQQLVDSVNLTSSTFSYEDQEFEIALHGIALISLESRLLAQAGSFAFDEGDIGGQIPISSRDDLSDKLMGRYNSGLEKYQNNYLYIQSLKNNEQETIAITMFDMKWPADQFSSGILSKFNELNLYGIFVKALVPLAVVLPCGFCIIFFASRQLKYRLDHLYKTIAFWSVGELHHRIQILSKDELGVSFERLNNMAERLAQNIETNNQLQTLRQRNMLAVELHDTVKQQLFANNLTLATCKQLLHSDVTQAEVLLDDVAAQNKVAFEQINRLISALHQPASNNSLSDELKKITDTWQQENDVKLNVDIELDIELPQGLKSLCCRALQESLQNIKKHSDASRVTLRLWCANKMIHFQLVDNGSVAQEIELGQGLTLLKSSVEEHAGVFDISIEKGVGVVTKIKLPIAKEIF
jgi:NarL family two-component system sensor histidine kinase LiaS